MASQDDSYWELLIKHSVSRFFLLGALYQRRMHGYEIRESIGQACGGCCQPTDAMIYPTIRELLEKGYILCHTETVNGRQRKVCSLTDKGVAAYRSAARVWMRVLPHLQRMVEASGSPPGH